MESADYLKKLFSYDDWANREALAAIERAPKPTERSRKLMAHIVAAEQLWLDRMRSDSQEMAVWPELTLAECRAQLDSLKSDWKKFLMQKNLSVEFSYKNSQGETWKSRVEDALMHVILHSSYHRGQIAADLRQSGSEPAYTDFIHSVRQGLVSD